MWFIPNSIDNVVGDEKEIKPTDKVNYKSKGQEKSLRRTAEMVGLSAILTLNALIYGCANNYQGRIQEPGKVESSSVTKEEKEFLKAYRAAGSPYLFEGISEFEKKYIDKGWNTKKLTDSQFVIVLREFQKYADDFAGKLKK